MHQLLLVLLALVAGSRPAVLALETTAASCAACLEQGGDWGWCAIEIDSVDFSKCMPRTARVDCVDIAVNDYLVASWIIHSPLCPFAPALTTITPTPTPTPTPMDLDAMAAALFAHAPIDPAHTTTTHTPISTTHARVYTTQTPIPTPHASVYTTHTPTTPAPKTPGPMVGDAVAAAALSSIDDEMAEAECRATNDCVSCGKKSSCQWCAQEAKVNIMMVPKETIYLMGACMHVSTPCSKVKFGEMNGIFDHHDDLVGGLYGRVTTLPDEKAVEKWCSTSEIPPELAVPSCNECVGKGPEFGWCHIAPTFSFLGYNVNASGGVCFRRSLGFACNTQLWPYKRSGMLSGATVDLKWITDAAYCAKPESLPPPTVTPEPSCTDNLSCEACGKSSSACTWCGGAAEVGMMGYKVGADILGACIEGSNASCDAVKFGDVAEMIKNGASKEAKFEVARLPFDDVGRCTTVEWPRQFTAPTCDACAKMQNSGWCQVDVSINPSAMLAMAPTSLTAENIATFVLASGTYDKGLEGGDATAPANDIWGLDDNFATKLRRPVYGPLRGLEGATAEEKIRVDGGACIEKSMSFLCSLAARPDVTLTWSTGSCPAKAT